MDTVLPTSVIADNLLPGDLLFQLRAGGEVEWVISRLFAGRDGMAINHVAIYDGDGQVIEAVMPEVRKTPLDAFIKSSVLDGRGHPCIMVCRVKPKFRSLVANALEFAEQRVASPYDSHYGSDKRSWYCSELVVDAFRTASTGNKGDFRLFEETPMSFRDMETGELLPFWIDHYQAIGQAIPEGEPGSHPALLSCSEKLLLINRMGFLPARGEHDWCALGSGATLA